MGFSVKLHPYLAEKCSDIIKLKIFENLRQSTVWQRHMCGQTDTKFLDMCGQTDTKFLDMCGQTDTKILDINKACTWQELMEMKLFFFDWILEPRTKATPRHVWTDRHKIPGHMWTDRHKNPGHKIGSRLQFQHPK